MIPVSLCMIMKNEAKHLRRCLDSVKDYGFELILVDTGSTDSTIEIASKYAETVYSFTWINDFSAARNYSLSLAKNDWVFILDCDEYVTSLHVDSLLEFIHQQPLAIGEMSRRNHYLMNGTDSVYTDRVGRFFNRRLYHYEGKVHEQVVPLPSSLITHIHFLPIRLEAEHSGYTGSKEELAAKALRDEILLREMLINNPNDPYLYFQLGQCYNMLHDDEAALYYYRKGLSYDVDPTAEYVQMMVIGYGHCLLHLNRYEEALTLQNIYEEFATSADFLNLMGLIFLRTGNLVPAMEEFTKAVNCPVAHTDGANSFIPYYNMGCINELLGEMDSALAFYRKCGDFPMAIEKLRQFTK